MGEEREHLVKKIFPEVRALCRKKGITFTEIDLRWGLTDEDVALGQVIRACLEEVDKCRPYFIGITGSRYGFVPSFLDIQKDPVLLQRYPWIEDATLNEMSITEMEAYYAVLGTATDHIDNQPADKARFYFRRQRRSFEDEEDENEELQKLEAYQQRIEANRQTTRFEAYQQRIEASGLPIERFRDPVSLGEMIYDDLIEIIKQDFANATPPTPLEEERARHEAFSLSRRRAYIANPAYLKRLDDHANGESLPLIVYAESGSGKSSLFAYWAEKHRKRNPNAHIIEHYVGIGATSTDHYAVIRHLCMEIKERFNREEEIPSEPKELEIAFGQWLGYAASELNKRGGKLILILDGLNQLQGEALELQWIPEIIPHSIRLILSSTVEGTLVVLRKRGWTQFGMQALNEQEREAVIVRYLAEFHKSLNPNQIKLIASDYKCGHPLFLKTLLEEIRLIGRHEELDRHIAAFLGTTGTEDLFQQVLERMEEDHGARAVRTVVSLISLSRDGLDERELAEISGISRLKITAMTAGLDYHLVRKAGRLTFFHDYLRRAVEKRYLSEEWYRNEGLRSIVNYFQETGLSERSAREILWGYKSLDDTPALARYLSNVAVVHRMYEEKMTYEIQSAWKYLVDHGVDVQQWYHRGVEEYRQSGIGQEELFDGLSILSELLMNMDYLDATEEIAREMHHIAQDLLDDRRTGRAEALLGRLHHYKCEYDSAIEHFKRSETLYERIGDHSGIASAKQCIGAVYAERDESTEALEAFQQALTIYQELNEKKEAALVISNLGAIYGRRGEHKQALEAHQQALTICQELDLKSMTAVVIGNMGVNYIAQEKYDHGLEAFRQALTIHQELAEKRMVALIVGNIGSVCSLQGDYGRALEACEEALIIHRELGEKNMIARTIGNIGAVHLYRGEYKPGLEAFQQALAIYQELEMQSKVAFILGNMGELYTDHGHYSLALQHLTQSVEIYRVHEARNLLPEWLEILSRVLLQICQEEDSLPEYLHQYIPELNSVSSEEQNSAGSWRQIVQTRARELAEESNQIAEEIKVDEFLFKSRLQLVRLDEAEGETASAQEQLHAMLAETKDPAQRAECHYWLWKFDNANVEHRSQGIRLFEEIIHTVPKHQYKDRLEELRVHESEPR